ncbi:MAG: VCBS repeat-containing protein [Patescibacteria group bacterium]
MKKKYKKAGLVLFLLIFLVLVVLFRTKVLKLANIQKKILPKKEAAVSFYAFSKNFRGKLNLACGKIGNDNQIIVVPQNSLPAIVKAFNKNGRKLWTSGAHSKYQGFNAALGDLDGDGKNEIVLGQTENKPQIFIYKQKGKKFVLAGSFAAFGDLHLGVNLALGDVNGDGKAEIIVGAGQGGGPQVKIFSFQANLKSSQEIEGKISELGNFFAFHPKMRHGVRIATLDFDDDGKDEIIALSNLERDTQFKIYKFDRIYSLQNVTRVYGKKIKIPANLLTVDINDDGKKEIIIMPQKKLGQEFKIFGHGAEIKNSFLDNYLDIEGGVNLAVCDLNNNKRNEVIINETGSKIKIFER